MHKWIVTTSVVFLLIGVALGKYLSHIPQTESKSKNDGSLKEVRASGYKFISPLLECETSEGYYEIDRLNHIQESVRTLIEAEKSKGVVTDVAVYFRDLNNGPWFGINEHAPFSPASLLKLPVMMAYYKKAETEPELLKEKVLYQGEDVLLEQGIPPMSVIQKGKDYVVEDLIERMMIYSDNAALTVLEKNIEPRLIDKITIDLGVETATENTPIDFMSVKGYASLFRILYNASYLSKSYSELSLDILTRSQFTKGLVAGVPAEVVVSHKFGERELEQNIVQLHDCGIIYGERPYLLCVMTRGTNFESLEKIIAKISKRTYEGAQNRAEAGTTP